MLEDIPDDERYPRRKVDGIDDPKEFAGGDGVEARGDHVDRLTSRYPGNQRGRMELIARVTMNEPILALTMTGDDHANSPADDEGQRTATGTERDLSAIATRQLLRPYLLRCRVQDRRRPRRVGPRRQRQ